MGALSVAMLILLRAAVGLGQAAPPIFYSGYLEDSAGVPATGPLNIELRLFEDEEPSDDDEPLCFSSSPEGGTAVTDGYFRLRLDTNCHDAIARQEQRKRIFVELSVEGEPLLPRSEVGAVPFAAAAETALGSAGNFSVGATLTVGGDITVTGNVDVPIGNVTGAIAEYEWFDTEATVADGDVESHYLSCPAGWVLITGGCGLESTRAEGTEFTRNYRHSDSRGWECRLRNHSGGTRDIHIRILCMRIPGREPEIE